MNPETRNLEPETSKISSYLEATTDGNDENLYTDLGSNDDTTDCEVRWYPMNIRHSSARKAFNVRQYLYEKGFTTYLRLEHSEQIKNDELCEIVKPVFSNLIFIHGKKKILRLLKNTDKNLTSLQFMTKVKHDRYERSVVISVSDKDMQNFIESETRDDPYKQRKRWRYDDANAKPGRKVRIIRGSFAGIVGEIKNYKSHRVVVIRLEGTGVANIITRIPKRDLEFID